MSEGLDKNEEKLSEEPTSTEEQKQEATEKIQATNSMELLEQSLKESQEKYLRLLAESENSRKRLQKERQELTKYAIENVLVEILHPLDSFEKALKFAENMSDEVKNWAVGFEMILGQFKQILTNHGAHPFESLGKHFDPHLHEAVEVVETQEHEPGIIVQEFLRGYRMGERIIRPARVKVAKTPEVPLQEQQEANNPQS